jgi:Copper transport outer membrane protein, MctB
VIQYRHHVVSLFAVFLALAVGVVLGGGPLTDVGRDVLSSDDTTAQPATNARTAEAAKFGDAFALQAAPALYDEGLASRPVTLVVLPGADEKVVAETQAQVEAAAGTVTATWTLTPGMVDPSEKALVDTLGSQLMTQLGDDVADQEAPTYERMGQLLARAIAAKGDAPTTVDADATSIRQSLVAAKLVVGPDDEAKRAPLVLVVLGDDANDDIVSGLVGGLSAGATGVVVAGDTAAGANGDIAALRATPVGAEVATVDGIETGPGQVAAALALIHALQTPGGSFGASGADGAAPTS